MKLKHFIASFLPVIVFSLAAFGQLPITENEFWREIRGSSDAGEKIVPRIETTISEEIENGKLVETSRTVAEYDAFGGSRITETNPMMQKGTTTTTIHVGKFYYCRENKGRWKKSSDFCGSMSIMSMSDALRSTFTTETIVEAGVKLVLISAEFIFSDTNGRAIEHFSKDKLWINPNKTVNRREMTNGIVGSAEISTRRTDTYNYSVSVPKIIAPIR